MRAEGGQKGPHGFNLSGGVREGYLGDGLEGAPGRVRARQELRDPVLRSRLDPEGSHLGHMIRSVLLKDASVQAASWKD